MVRFVPYDAIITDHRSLLNRFLLAFEPVFKKLLIFRTLVLSSDYLKVAVALESHQVCSYEKHGLVTYLPPSDIETNQ